VDSGRPGPETAQIIIDGADCHQFVIGPDALAAQNALAQIPDDEWICLFKGLEIVHAVKVRLTDPEICGHLTQPAAIAFAADNAGLGVFGNHQADNIAAVFNDAVGFGVKGHLRSRRSDAGSHETSGFLIFHQAHAAGTERLEIRMVAQSGNFYAVLVGGFKDTGFGAAGDFPAVDGQRDGFHGVDSFLATSAYF
jgi:hypothetical protein